jgi:hypothetical protein
MVTEPESRKGPGNRTPLTGRLTVTPWSRDHFDSYWAQSVQPCEAKPRSEAETVTT